MRKVQKWLGVVDRPVRLLLRMEVVVPFGFFSWPLAWVAALIFAAVNTVAEDGYLGEVKFLPKLLALTKGCLANVVAFGLGMCATAKLTHLRKGVRWIDWENVSAALVVWLGVSLGMFAWRILFLAVEHYLVPKACGTRKGKEA